MLSRVAKVAWVTARLNDYLAKELGSSTRLTEQEVNNKVDSAKRKGRELYRKFAVKAQTTGSALDDGEAGSGIVDLQQATAVWANFGTYHRLFAGHPSWGPGSSVESCAVKAVDSDEEDTYTANALQLVASGSSSSSAPVSPCGSPTPPPLGVCHSPCPISTPPVALGVPSTVPRLSSSSPSSKKRKAPPAEKCADATSAGDTDTSACGSRFAAAPKKAKQATGSKTALAKDLQTMQDKLLQHEKEMQKAMMEFDMAAVIY